MNVTTTFGGGCCASLSSQRQRATVAIGGEAVEADQAGDRRRDVGEAHALLGVRRRDEPGRDDDQRHPLEVHPHRGMARVRVARAQAQRLRGVVRAVARRQHELEVAGAAGVEGAAHELHVLRPEVAGHRRLDRGRVGQERPLEGPSGDGAGPREHQAGAGRREAQEPPPPRIVLLRRRQQRPADRRDGDGAGDDEPGAHGVAEAAGGGDHERERPTQEGQERQRTADPAGVHGVPVSQRSAVCGGPTRACAAGPGTASARRWRPPCRARPRRSTRPTPWCRAPGGWARRSRSRPSS